uniref:Uncharacterized protein n=1 Tax=Panagrolaimus davidi TaxID=227884 RepID=A0A914QKU9_9BILA
MLKILKIPLNSFLGPYERRSSTPPPSRIYGNFARPYNLPRKVNQAREVDNQAREVGNQAREFRNQAREVGNQAREVNNQAREVVDAASAGTRNHVNPQNEFRDSSRSQEPIRPPLNRLASPIPALSLNMHHLPPPPVVPIEDEYPNDAMSHYSSEMNFYPKREAFVNSQDELQLVEDDEDLERPFETNGNDYNDNHQRLSNAEFRVHVQEPEYNHHSINRYDENWQGERGSQRDFRRDEDHANLRPLERNHNDLNGNHQQSPNSGFETDDNIQARDVHEQQQPPRRPRSASQWPENRFGQNIPQRNFYNFDDNRNFLAIVQPNANENHQEPTNTGLQPLANDAFEQQRESPPWKMAIEKWLKESEPYWRFY